MHNFYYLLSKINRFLNILNIVIGFIFWTYLLRTYLFRRKIGTDAINGVCVGVENRARGF
ncbi:hypothetical protein NIES25_14720 [Nostoc linckia NIES-25]|nr:hypothetical protein NIES25_14720 [Nostoc linckia NIES-25]